MNMKLVQQYIKHIELFHGLKPEEVVKIISRGMTMHCVKGETLFHKGTTGNQMYVVLAGKVGVYDDDNCISALTMGDMFGEMALVNKEPRTATVKALEDSHLFVLSETVFDRLMTKRIAIRMLLNIIHTLSRRLKAANVKLIH